MNLHFFYCYPVNNVISRNIKLNMRMRRKGSNPSTMLMMMRTVMAAQRETVVARQMCWEQYRHASHHGLAPPGPATLGLAEVRRLLLGPVSSQSSDAASLSLPPEVC